MVVTFRLCLMPELSLESALLPPRSGRVKSDGSFLISMLFTFNLDMELDPGLFLAEVERLDYLLPTLGIFF